MIIPLDFTATEFSTIQDKEKFYNHFIKFVESDFNENLFYKWFYTRLSMCFGHIAHYNKNGFYHAQFSTNDKRADFMRNMFKYPCYGLPNFTFCDVEKALQVHFNGGIEVFHPMF